MSDPQAVFTLRGAGTDIRFIPGAGQVQFDGDFAGQHYSAQQFSGDQVVTSETAIGTLTIVSLLVPGARVTVNHQFALLAPAVDAVASGPMDVTAVAVFTSSLGRDDYEVRILQGTVEPTQAPTTP